MCVICATVILTWLVEKELYILSREHSLEENCNLLTFDRDFGWIGNWNAIDVLDRFPHRLELLDLARLYLKK